MYCATDVAVGNIKLENEMELLTFILIVTLTGKCGIIIKEHVDILEKSRGEFIMPPVYDIVIVLITMFSWFAFIYIGNV